MAEKTRRTAAESTDRALADWRERTVRAEIGRGSGLPDRFRDALERAYGLDLGAIRLHHDETADRVARSLGTDACTAGTDVFVGAGAPDLASDAGVELVAHEVAHTAQQALRQGDINPTAAEHQAQAMARAFTRGRLPDAPHRRRARPLQDRDAALFQCHSSWEHRMLGDFRTLDFDVIAGGGANRKAFLQRVQQYLAMWETNPKAVGADRIVKDFDYLHPLVLKGSGLVVTYGELNTLADYLATPADLDSRSEADLLPILQQVRQEGYAWTTWIIEDQWLRKDLVFGGFQGSVANTLGSETADALWETFKMNSHTEQWGPHGMDKYNTLLGRNACHFAPHSWYRWEEFYLQARAYAEEAFYATGDRQNRLTNLAWVHHGYADHFLHDSFAAGHLVNKTLVMQWYIDWVAKTLTPVPDWDLVQFMTAGRQPNLAGKPLYGAFLNNAARGRVRDPQTAHEWWTPAARIAASGVVADGSTVASSYKRFLAFLGAGVVQLSSNAVHDHFNGESLWVSSKAHTSAFQIWGDNTMIRSGDGYRFANEAAQLSQRSIQEILAKGSTSHTVEEISGHFPTKVHDNAQNRSVSRSLEDWAYGLKDQASGWFDGFKNRAVGALRLRLEPVNIDKVGGWEWQKVQGQAGDIAVGGDGVVWALGKIPAGGDAPVYYWDASKSSWEKPKAGGAGVRIAAGGDGVVWVVNAAGNSYCARPQQASQWEKGDVVTVNGSTGLVDIAAGSDGSVWGLAKAPVAGGHPVLRCVRGSGKHSWERVDGGAMNLSVGPDGLPWLVNYDGVLMRLIPSKAQNRYEGGGVQWPNITPGGRKAKDIGLGTGSMVSAFVTTDEGIFGWNGRLPTSSGTAMPDWEDLGGRAERVATGPDGRAWLVNANADVFRLSPREQALCVFTTNDAGKVRGTARAADGSLFQDEYVWINGSTDLQNVIKGNSGACVYKMWLTRSPIPAFFYRLHIDGQGPAGIGSGWLNIYIEDEGGYKEPKGFFRRDRQTMTMDYVGTKAGIIRISWSDGNDPG
jgi:Domain of unknown function (DUF4157)/Tectonin domain